MGVARVEYLLRARLSGLLLRIGLAELGVV
jgi:hypothetical protein